MHELKRGISEGTHTLYDRQTFRAMFKEITIYVDGEEKKGYIPILLDRPEGGNILFGEEIEVLEK